MTFDLAHPTQQQLRDGVICGLIAESIMIPILLTLAFVEHQSVRWGYLVAATACIFVSVVTLALFVALNKGRATLRAQATVWFVVVCLAMAGLAGIQLAAARHPGLYTPAMLVGVIFVCIVGDRRMQVAVGAWALALIALVDWVDGLRGGDFAVSLVIYGSTIAVITLICARTVGSLTGQVNLSQALDALNETFADLGFDGPGTGPDSFAEIFRQGLPQVAGVLPAERVAVFARNSSLERFVLVAVWPEGASDPADLAGLPELTRVLVTHEADVSAEHVVVPVGYSSAGELVMVVDRHGSEARTDARTVEAADLVAAAFLRATSRANFVHGLHTESRTDPLTGLANRRSLFERIEIEMAHALRADTPLSVAMIDLDHFKDYNDQYGHVAGDTVLRSIAAVMVSNIRGQDMVARYGGEEFCLVMPDTDLLGGHHLLDKLRGGGRDATSDFGVTLSAGLTSWDGREDPQSFIERADQALYRAKETGRNRVVSIEAFTEF